MKKSAIKPTKKRRFPFATGNAVLRAYGRVSKRLGEDHLISASSDAGFIMLPSPKGGPRFGYQVFVTIEAWNEDALKAWPESGGLVRVARDMAMEKARIGLLGTLGKNPKPKWKNFSTKKGGAK